MTEFLPTANLSLILCCYANLTPQMQIIRIANSPDFYLERVAFPGEKLLFRAPFDAQLEVHTGMFVSSILSDTIACQTLKVKQPDALGAIADRLD
ncbi:DUF1830 domain-containing protein [Myxacorys almedinensis]|uniref:DUF1830 domain-containing protein n=1 Tax=Myxacorys almedinensis A TaxID=2690445 RepID=A0A8J8CID5_9CYAN|nr:DUF1830 domain-containing protein [Myxacorys almedinensis]NDJ16371.1 DUF1830 domain-containing protein [Myxacorys almedinensis A]